MEVGLAAKKSLWTPCACRIQQQEEEEEEEDGGGGGWQREDGIGS